MRGWAAWPTTWVLSAGHPDSVAVRDDGCSIREQNAHCWHHTQDSCPATVKWSLSLLVLDDNKRGKKQQKQKIKQKWNNTSLCMASFMEHWENVCDILPYKKRQTKQAYYSQKQPHILSTVTTHSAPQNKQTAEKLRRRSFLCFGFVVSQSVIAS